MRAAIVIGLGVVALAGCQKKDDAAPSAAQTAEPAAAAPMSMARKPGLWTQTVQTEGVSQVIKVCLDAATDKQMQITGQAVGKDMCSENTVTPAPGGFTFRSVCDTGPGGKSVTTGSTSGDLNSNYTVKASTTTTGAQMAQANGTRAVEITAKWEGACPAGMTPGDMQLPGGITVNAAKMMGQMQGGAGK